MTRLNDVANGRNNNFNLLRMIAATAVLVSHAYPISLGNGASEPLSSLLQMSLGTLAVLSFFAISGFFISQSFDRSNGLVSFAVARVLRVYPGLGVVLLLTVLVLGPIFTTQPLSSFFTQPETFLYLPRNLSLKWLQYDLPGVFQRNPYGPAINGSLWSLFYEITCYGLVVVLGSISLKGRSWAFNSFLALYAAAYVLLKVCGRGLLDHSGLLANFHLLTLPFVIGMTFYRYRRFLPLNFLLLIIVCILPFLIHGNYWFKEVFVICWCYLIFYAGYLQFAPLQTYNMLGDYSYGMYIYAFPCQQMIVSFWSDISPLTLIWISLPVTLAASVLSWHFIESWALAHRLCMAQWLQSRLVCPPPIRESRLDEGRRYDLMRRAGPLKPPP
jgi:peptidoglycan/LPS O-acetylase OafA/YrhL